IAAGVAREKETGPSLGRACWLLSWMRDSGHLLVTLPDTRSRTTGCSLSGAFSLASAAFCSAAATIERAPDSSAGLKYGTGSEPVSLYSLLVNSCQDMSLARCQAAACASRLSSLP